MEPVSWMALAATVLGIVAEVLRRVWKAKDEKKVEHEQAEKDRDDAWDRRDAGGVFNPPKD